jgi:hypothetical protein
VVNRGLGFTVHTSPLTIPASVSLQRACPRFHDVVHRYTSVQIHQRKAFPVDKLTLLGCGNISNIKSVTKTAGDREIPLVFIKLACTKRRLLKTGKTNARPVWL